MTDLPTVERDLEHLPLLAGVIGAVFLLWWLVLVLNGSDVLAALMAVFVLYARKSLEPPA